MVGRNLARVRITVKDSGQRQIRDGVFSVAMSFPILMVLCQLKRGLSTLGYEV